MNDYRHLFIVGAGFSRNAGLPLALEFTERLLDISRVKIGKPSDVLVEYMRRVVDDIFGAGSVLDAEDWPTLEDLFTTIDLAANTGHNLGPKYSSSDLRTVRRALLVRLIRMLRSSLRYRRKHPDGSWLKMSEFFRDLDTVKSAFLSMNWDNVVEEFVVQEQGAHEIDYGFDALPATFFKGAVQLRRGVRPSKLLTVLKPHGSINWMYCDSCRRLYSFNPNDTERIASSLFKASDAERVLSAIGRTPSSTTRPALCPVCKAEALGTRFATFSYRKALDFPMYQATWSRAERLLRDSDNWVFFGYSMPAADYEFKHLLKHVHLSRLNKPSIYLVTKATVGDNTAIQNLRRFFGPRAGSALSDSKRDFRLR